MYNNRKRVVLIGLLSLLFGFPVFGQTVPARFWDAPLTYSDLILGTSEPVPVKRIFRDAPFTSTLQMDGTRKESRLKKTKVSGNDVFLTIDTLSGNQVLATVVWQLTYQSSSQTVLIHRIELSDPASGTRSTLDGDLVKSSGDAYQQFLLSIQSLLQAYYDLDKIAGRETSPR